MRFKPFLSSLRTPTPGQPTERRPRGGRRLRPSFEALEGRLLPSGIPQRLLDINQDTLDGVLAAPPLGSIPFVWQEYNGAVYFPATQQTPGYGDPSFELWKTD